MTIARYQAKVDAIEAAISCFGILREHGIGLDMMSVKMNDSRVALYIAHDDLMDNAPSVSGADFLEAHGSKSNSPITARMVQAAPDMLAALRQCLPILEALRESIGDDLDMAVPAVRDAIRKATSGD